MTGPSKVCEVCKESIHADARKCPRCQQWQGWARWFIYAPLVIYMLLMVAFFVFTTSERDDAYFPDHREKVSIVDASMHYEAGEKCPNVSVVGIVRNESDLAWKNVFLEVRYYDAAGALVDAVSSEEYGMVLPANGDAAFSVRAHAVRPERDYATYRVEVKGARDGRSRF